MNLSSNVSVDYSSLDELNDARIALLIPNTILLVLLLAISLIGNGIVLYIYTFKINLFKLKKQTDDRYFIPCMSVLDIYTCLIGSLFGMILNSNPLMLRYNLVCILMGTFSKVGAVSSALILLATAVQRYKKVCTPFKAPMSLKTRRAAVVIVIVGSSFLALPCIFLYGKTEIQIKSGQLNVTGYICDMRRDANKNVLIGYSVFFLTVAFVGVLSTAILYYKILRTIYRQASFRKRGRSLHTLTKDQRGNETSVSQCSVSNTEPDTATEITSSSLTNTRTSKHASEVSKTHVKKTHASQGKFATCKRATKKHRIAIMFFLLTVIYVVSYFPRIVLMNIESMYSDFWELITDAEHVIYLSLYRSYLLNNAVNPIIYFIFDSSFKAACKDVFCKAACQ